MAHNFSKSKATFERLESLAAKGYLDQPALERAYDVAGHIPGLTAWRKFLDMALLVLGAAFVISGIFFFFAYNWADLSAFFKFGLIEAGILAATGLAYYLGLDALPGKVGLTGAALLVGVLLAVFGQVYQTGADAYQLFLTWSILIVGWVLISRFSGLWLALVILLNVTIITYWSQVLDTNYPAMFVILAGLNAAALIGWEVAHAYGVEWLHHRWLPSLMIIASLLFLVIPTLNFIFDDERSGVFLFLAPVLYVGFIGVTLYFYQTVVPDLFSLTAAAFSLIVVLTSIMIKLFGVENFENAGMLLLISVIIIGQTAAAVIWLRRVSFAWEVTDV